MPSPVSSVLSDYQREVEAQLQRCIAALPGDSLREAMAYSVLSGGKRIRPALCYATAAIFGPVNDLTRRSGTALELIHAYSLIHDDLPAMDNDDLRRGKPTCHIAFDEATAILAGDALQTLAFAVLAEPLPGTVGTADTQLRLIQLLAEASGAHGMVRGQAMDLQAVNQSLDLSQLEQMHRHKTGALISASILMGAVSSGAVGDVDLDILRRYGTAVGLAFQVKDDILDVESSTATLGKRQGADLARNKPTYTSLLGVDGAKLKLAELYQAALCEARELGPRGQVLEDIANFIVERSH